MKTTSSQAAGFTLVELMVSMSILSIIAVIMVQMTGQASNIWRYTTGKAEQFREARNGFETMTRRISQATLNTYWDYDNPNDPKGYQRQSDLRFICGPMQTGLTRLDSTSSIPRPTHGIFFQAPFGFVAPARSGDTSYLNYQGLETALNTWGYYVEVNDDQALRPPMLSPEQAPLRVRSRLMEMTQPTGAMNIYQYTSGTPSGNPTITRSYKGFEWFRGGLTTTQVTNTQLQVSHVLAENIIAVCFLPKLTRQDAQDLGAAESSWDTLLAPNYYYHSAEVGEAARYPTNSTMAGGVNSKHQLPPVVQVTMVAVDETSAQRMNITDKAKDPFGIRASTFLTKAANYSSDLLLDSTGPNDSLERRLIDAKVNYRIFTSNVVIRGAKWSREQAN